MNDAVDVRAFSSQAALAPVLAAAVAADLCSAVASRGRAVLAVSGGSTPVPFFIELQQAKLDWSRVTVTLVDERWVAIDHPDSNAGLVQRHLLQGAAARAHFQPLGNAAVTAEQGCPTTEALIAPLCPLDVAVLGMGADGHTASWFPGATNLAQALDAGSHQCCVALQPPQGGHERISLSLQAVLSAGRRYLHFTGPGKWTTFERALMPGPVAELPVRALLHDPRSPQVFYAVNDTLQEDMT